jgi:tRNA dimethylallyltransferase
MRAKRAVLIAGPTASGKSALALAVAERIGRAAIVNADSMQVYRDLRILTARPGAEETSRARHELFGIVDGADAYSVARYAEDVAGLLPRLARDGLVPIIVGGTGLYFKALLEGLSPVPAIDPEVRDRLRRQADSIGAAGMHALLAAADPAMAARLAPTDTQRITRALEVIKSTGRSLAEWQKLPGTPVIEPDLAARFVLSPPRDVLMGRCDTRFEAMIAAGAVDEVAALHARGLPRDLPVMRALGVSALIAHIDGRLSLEAASEQAKAETRQFAKRQATWIRRHMIAWRYLETNEMERNCADIISNIDF